MAIIRYCGHDASFVADIYMVGTAAVVRATGPITQERRLTRPYDQKWTHWVIDNPDQGFWRPDLGVLVVPQTQLLKRKGVPEGLR